MKNPSESAQQPSKAPASKRAGSKTRTTKKTPPDAGAEAAAKPRRSRRATAAPKEKTRAQPAGALPSATAGPGEFFVGRGGVALGPYTASQLHASLRLGIFAPGDLGLAGNSPEWQELSRLLPAEEPAPPTQEPAAPPAEWQEVSVVLPMMRGTRALRPERRPWVPLSSHQLHEHTTRFAQPPVAAFLSELTRGRFAIAAVPAVVVVLALLSLAAVCKRSAPPARVDRQTHLAAAHPPEPGTITPVSLTAANPPLASGRPPR